MSSFSSLENEVLLQSDENRLTIFPIKYQNIWEMYQKAVSTFWVPEEIDFSRDIDDWNSLTDNERYFIRHILAFFSSSDTIVNMNIGERFISEVKPLEAKFFYNFQEAMENIHSQTYSLLIDTYIQNPNEKNETFNAIMHIPCIKKKADWGHGGIEPPTTSTLRKYHATRPKPQTVRTFCKFELLTVYSQGMKSQSPMFRR